MSAAIFVFSAILFRQTARAALLTDFSNVLLQDADQIDDEAENSIPTGLDDIVFNGNLSHKNFKFYPAGT